MITDIAMIGALILAPAVGIIVTSLLGLGSSVCSGQHAVCSTYWGSYEGMPAAATACQPLMSPRWQQRYAQNDSHSSSRVLGSW